jgi:hypothetical protein
MAYDYPNTPGSGQVVVLPDGSERVWDGGKWLAGSAIGAQAPAITIIADSPPPAPSTGTLWYDTTGCELYVWYNDGNSSQWVVANSMMGGPYATQSWVTSQLANTLPTSGGRLSGPGNLGLNNSVTMPVNAAGGTLMLGSEIISNTTLPIVINAYLAGTTWTYLGNGPAALLQLETDGSINHYTALSGTAGNAVTWSPRYKQANNGTTTITSSAQDPLQLNTPAGTWSRVRYNNTARIWSAGVTNNNTFVIADETAGAYRVEIDTAGNTSFDTGNIRQLGGRIISESGSNPSVCVWNTVGYASVMWEDGSGNFLFGDSDGSGNPSGWRFYVDRSNNFHAGGIYAGYLNSSGNIDAGGNIGTGAAVTAGWLHSTGNYQIDGSGQVNGNLTIAGVAYGGGDGGGFTFRTYGNTDQACMQWAAIGSVWCPIMRVNGSGQILLRDRNCQDLQYVGGIGAGPTNIGLYGTDHGGQGYWIYVDQLPSDARIKEKIKPTEVDALAVLCALPVNQFDVKGDAAAWYRGAHLDLAERRAAMTSAKPAHVPIGLVAQQVMASVPEAVMVTDAERFPAAEGSPLPGDMHTINQQMLIPYIIKAIQQLAARR